MKKLFVLFVLYASVSNISFANYGAIDAGSLNSQAVRDMRLHAAETRSKQKNAIIQTKTLPKTEEQITTSDIKFIVFVNNKSIPSGELLNVVKNRLNKPMNTENVSAIRKDIMRYYQDKGYYSALALINTQDTNSGELVIEIKEGGRNSIIIEE